MSRCLVCVSRDEEKTYMGEGHAETDESIFAAAEKSLSLPSGDAVYSFEERAGHLLTEAMQKLRNCTDATVVDYQVPWLSFASQHSLGGFGNDQRFVTLPAPQFRGRPLVLIEPHCDDVALSFVGTLLSWQRPVVVVTLFNLSRTKDDKLPISQQLTYKSISYLRQAENECGLGLGLGAKCLFLNEWEEPWPWGPPDTSRIANLADRVAPLVDLANSEIAAPFGFSPHPDHFLARAVADQLGCNLYWEDIGFFREYSRCTEDREYGFDRWPGTYETNVISIDGYALQKMAILTTYQSQMYPPARMMSLLRYHWAVARQAHRECPNYNAGRFAERLYKGL